MSRFTNFFSSFRSRTGGKNKLIKEAKEEYRRRKEQVDSERTEDLLITSEWFYKEWANIDKTMTGVEKEKAHKKLIENRDNLVKNFKETYRKQLIEHEQWFNNRIEKITGVNPGQPQQDKDLNIMFLDLLVAENAKAHRTSDFHCVEEEGRCVVRRGKNFTIKITFNKPFNSRKHDLQMLLRYDCDNALESKGTEGEITLSEREKPNKWGAKFVKAEGNNIWVTVFPPPSCPIGNWLFLFNVFKRKEFDPFPIYKYFDKFIVLFNPWNKGDTVYMDDERLLKEYVLTEQGRLWKGTADNPKWIGWNYAQFEKDVLDIALDLLAMEARDFIQAEDRGDPVKVVRKISSAVNSFDDNGVLYPRWSDVHDYPDGTPPYEWTGSASILQEYHETKKPVKYGQCWCYAGLCTTVSRALGIPTRLLTNYQSAHDGKNDGTFTVHLYFDRNDVLVNKGDSVWNFHCWNEAWMARPDLPSGYGGWQAFDGTAQEVSTGFDNMGIFRCGPASVEAIRQGEINFPYDAKFIYSEVNADMYQYEERHDGKFYLFLTDFKRIGQFISTKAVGGRDRDDITHTYKPDEGTTQERTSIRNARRLAGGRVDENVVNARNPDVDFIINQTATDTLVGNDFGIHLIVSSRAHETRTVTGSLKVSSMFYTGVIGELIKKEQFNFKLAAYSTENVRINLSENDYLEKLKDSCLLDVSVLASVDETKQIFGRKENYQMDKPHLKIEGSNEVYLNQNVDLVVSFDNPLWHKTLTGCVLRVEGWGGSHKFLQSDVRPQGTFSDRIRIPAKKLGHTELSVVFSCKELHEITGVKELHVQHF